MNLKDIFKTKTQNKDLSVGDLRKILSGNWARIDSDSLVSSELFDYYLGWAKVAIDLIGEKIASTKFIVKNKKSGEIVNEHPLLDLLETPNEYQSKFEFLERLAIYLEVLGNAPIRIVKAGNSIHGLYFLDPTKLEVVKDKSGKPTHYFYWKGRDKEKFELDEVIPFHSFSPLNFFDGQSAIESNKYILQAMLELQKWELKLFSTMMPSLAFSFDRFIDADEIERIKVQVKKKYSGSRGAFEPLIIGKGGEVKRVGLTPRDLDLTAIENMVRDKVLGIFRVPKAVLGITKDVNRATAQASLETFLANTITPKVVRIVDYFNRFLVSKYFKDVVLDFEPLVKDSKWEEIDSIVKAVGGKPIISQNEARQEIGFEPAEDSSADSIEQPMQILDTSKVEKEKKKELKEVFKLKKEVKQLKNALTQAQRLDIIAKEKEQKAIKREAILKQMFKEYADEYIDRLKDKLQKITQLDVMSYVRKGLVDFNAEQAIVYEMLNAFAKYLYDQNRQDILEYIEDDLLVPEIDIDKFYRRALEKKAESISKTIGEYSLNTILESLKAGDSIADIVSKLDKDVKDYISYTEAERVARTETTFLSNDMTIQMYKEMGIQELVWVAVGDARTRDSHASLHGQSVKLGEFFVTNKGNKLKYPGDPNAPVEEIVNCRCSIIANNFI